MYRGHEDDLEKSIGIGTKETGSSSRFSFSDNAAAPGDSFEYGTSLYAKTQRLLGKLHVEQRGIERVPEDERNDTSYLNVGSMVRLSYCSLFGPI